MQACDRCHARKTRCDRRFPQCGACEKAGVSCVHADKLRQRNIPRGYLDSMESLVRQLQEENDTLRQSLAASQGTTQATVSDTHTSADVTLPDALPDHAIVDAPVSPPSSSPGSGSSPDNAFAVEVGFLSLIATGETRYLGSSSGLGLANIISTMISAQVRIEQEAPESSGSRPAPAPGDASLPPLATVKPFIESYFQHTHITFPLLHRPTFLANVEKIYDEPGYYEKNPYEAFVFNMVLAIGSSNFNRFEESAASSSKYFAMAQSKLGSVLSMDGFTSLKAILLVSQHGIFSNLRDTSASIWHLVGIGARISIELGLHLERKQLGCDILDPHQPISITLDEELRKRCFWCLYNLDRVVSFTLGRPVVIRDEEIDVSLPSHLDDDCFSADLPATMLPLNDTDSPKNISPFLHLIRIRKLSGQILTQFYNSRQQKSMPMEERKRIRRRFHADINAWKKDTQQLPGIASTGSETGYKSSFLTPDWYNAVYSNAILLLYRPSPFLPHPTMSSGLEDGEPELIQLLNAAISSIESYSHLHRKRRLNYSWITLHGVFIAGLAYIYSVGRLLRDPASFRQVPELFSIVEVTRSCSNVLVAICERWNASRRSCDLFNKLSNAVIRDALNASSRQLQNGSLDGGGQPYAPPVNQPNASAPGHGQRRNDEAAMPYDGAAMNGVLNNQIPLDDNFVMGEFREFMGSIDAAHPGDQSFPSELVSGFLQDWPFDIPINEEPEFNDNVSDSGTNLLNWDLGAG